MSERDIFDAALAIDDPVQRAAYLDRVCAGDPGLREHLDGLLSMHGQVGSFLEAPALAVVATIDDPIRERPGTVIGPYKLLEQIGEGGFGVVFMAEQTQPVRRKVALKVLKPGMDTRQVVARFEAERQALALMDHPNIARVLDGGQTDGRPYFVMDLVKGLPITDYCDQARLPLRERLELFEHLCQAVQHAHQKGIIHRDLKPSNVLVTLHDGSPLVKVIDFGIAKALGQQLTDKTLFTGFAQMVGTPLYMSPEQAALSNVDVDTRSDVYSLGVLLYELLTGTTPFDQDRLKEVGFDELRRIIREEEPPRPSTRISTLGKAATTLSTQRHSDPKRLSQLCRGELDWIVMKSLEKDRNRRYQSASALAADVQHYLRDEPVQACPPSAWYRFRKFIRRKKTGLVVAACVLLALAGIAGGIGWAVRDRTAREEGIERDRLAREEALDQTVARTLEATGPFMEQGDWPEALAGVERADKLLAVAGRTERPARLLELRKQLVLAERLEGISQQPKRDLKVRVLMSSEGRLEYTLPEQPASSEEDFFTGRQADAAFAHAFRDLGIDIDALPAAEVAAEIARHGVRAALVKALDEWAPLRRWARGDNHPGWKKLVAIARLADPDPWRNRCREALLRRDRPALEELADTVPIPQVPPKTLWLLGLTLKEVGALDRAMDLLRRAQHQYPTDLWINDTLGGFSWSEFHPPRTDDALRFYSIALALRPTRPQLHFMVAVILGAKGALEDAVLEYSRAIELDPQYGMALNNRAVAYSNLHQSDKALADRTRIIELYPKSAEAWNRRAGAYWILHQYDKALGDCNKSIELSPKSAPGWDFRGVTYWKLRDYDKAVADFSRAIELDLKYAQAWYHRGSLYNALHQSDRALADIARAIELAPKSGWAWNVRGSIYNELHQSDEALAACREAAACWREEIERNPRNAWAHSSLGDTLSAQQKLDEAIACYQKAIEIDPKYAPAHSGLGIVLHQQKKLDEAIAEYRKAIDSDPKFARAHDGLGNVLYQQKKLDEAIAEYRKAIELDPKDVLAHNNLGSALGRQGKLDEAVAEYRKAIELDPKYAPAHNGLGLALSKQGKADEAIAEYRKAIDIDPKDALAHNNLGFALSDQNKLDEAIACYRRAIALDPKDALAHNNLGFALYKQWKLDEAIACYRRAIALDPKDALAHNNLGNALCDRGELDEAIACYKKAIDLEPKTAASHCELGNALGKQGKGDEAIACYKKAIELDPKLAIAHFHLGNILCYQRKLDEAIACYKKAIQLDPKLTVSVSGRADLLANPWDPKRRDPAGALRIAQAVVELRPKEAAGWRSLAWARYRNRDWKGTVAAMTRVEELGSNGYSIEWFVLAMAHWQLGDKGEARRWYDKAAAWMDKNQPKSALSYAWYRVEAEELMNIGLSDAASCLWRGIFLRDYRRDYDGAIAAFRKASDLDPSLADAHFQLGVTFQRQGKLDQAVAAWKKTVELDPMDRVAHSQLAVTLHTQGKLEEAIACYRKAIELEPRDLFCRDRLAWILATCADLKLRNPAEALELARKTVELVPGYGGYWLTLGTARYRVGDWKEAVSAVEKSIALGHGGGYDWFILAMAHWRLGDKEEARKWFDQAVEWMDKQQPKNEELDRLRAEAAELLNVEKKH
jgi:tetratricopeptide (TPR) repeat protein/serine/threonine protein kinase